MKKHVFLSLLLALVGLMTNSCADKDQTKYSFEGANQGNQKEVSVDNSSEVTIDENDEILNKSLTDLQDVFFKNFAVQVTGTGSGFDTLVDYDSLHALRVRKDQDYLKLVNAIELKIAKKDLLKATNDEKVAFYINAYNFLAIRLINKNYYQKGRIIKSIKDLSEGLNPFEIFKRKMFKVAGENLSFDDIEKVKVKGLLTSGEKVDARFHFAVICVSKGCPITLNESFKGDRLNSQLDFVTREGLKLDRMLKIEGETRYQTMLFDWYKSDFEKDAGSVTDFIKRYVPNLPETTKEKYIDYSWDLNRLKAKRPVPDLPDLGDDGSSNDINIKCPAIILKKKSYDAVKFCGEVKSAESNFGEVVKEKTSVCFYKNPSDSKEAYIALSLVATGENSEGETFESTQALSDKLKLNEENDDFANYKKGFFTKIKVELDKKENTLHYVRKAGFSKKKTIISFSCDQ
ncbi:MAG: DUF547 domain-containing protein [Oligoflexia bacterium]|nr:DUF547 domain-containing protein [Oligoflexia bacterium]